MKDEGREEQRAKSKEQEIEYCRMNIEFFRIGRFKDLKITKLEYFGIIILDF